MIEQDVDIPTRDGEMPAFVCHPERDGPYPPVLFLMDAPGIREELRDMVRRLATVGYFVVLPNLYYRAGRDTVYGPDVLVDGSAEHARMRAVRTKMTIPAGDGRRRRHDRLPRRTTRGEARPGGGTRVLHERPVRVGRCCSISRSGPCGGVVLWHLAGERRRGEPAPEPRQGDRRGVHRLRRARRPRPARHGGRAEGRSSTHPVRVASWRSTRGSTMASPSRTVVLRQARRRTALGAAAVALRSQPRLTGPRSRSDGAGEDAPRTVPDSRSDPPQPCDVAAPADRVVHRHLVPARALSARRAGLRARLVRHGLLRRPRLHLRHVHRLARAGPAWCGPGTRARPDPAALVRGGRHRADRPGPRRCPRASTTRSTPLGCGRRWIT